MAWIYLIAAIAFEIAATLSLKQSAGLTKVGWTVSLVVGYLASFVMLSRALKTLEVGTAYAIWAAAGTALVAAVGMIFLGEAVSLGKVAGLALMIAGVVTLNLSTAH